MKYNSIYKSVPAVLIGIAVLGVSKASGAYSGPEKQPVYVGSRVCAQCHRGPGMGYQFSKWLLSKHASAYAVLAKPEAKKIAELSGVPEEPQDSPVCLGCHATGAHAESWEKDETFHVEDGVQCEKCHGPGSEYMDEDTMRDAKAAREAGLQMPTREDCMNCHQVKGSHVAVHNLPKLDIDKAWKEIAHPIPGNSSYGSPPTLPEPVDKKRPRYVGSLVCARCHRGHAMGYQYSLWRKSPHAKAFAVLATPKACRIVKRKDTKKSPQHVKLCLKCHATGFVDPAGGFAETFDVSEGVTCEACHGPGSQYAVEAIMRDSKAAKLAGLKLGRDTCTACHKSTEKKPFDLREALKAIAHPTELPPETAEVVYKTPLNLALSPDASQLYVACEASDSVIAVDVKSRRRVAEIPVGRKPAHVTFSPDGATAFVSNRLDDTVSVINTMARKVVATIKVGDEPHGVLTDPEGRYLYVLNTLEDSISVVDIAKKTEIRRLAAGRRPWSLALAPDGKHIYVTNALSHFVPFRKPPLSEVTVIETKRGIVVDRLKVPAANMMLGIAWHPKGLFALATLNRTKNLVPMTRLLQGWTITNGLAVLWPDGRVDQVLLDEPSICFPDASDVAFTPDGKYALVTSSGSNRVAVVEVEKLRSIISKASAYERKHILPNHLGIPTEFVLTYLETGFSPRGIVVTPDGRTAFVANALDDTLTVIDIDSLQVAGTVDLGGPKVITKARFGERVFHSAQVCFHRQFSCHTCHPDGHVDGLTYDIEPDGIGVDPVDNRTLRGILDTAPFKWTGKNPSLRRQCGARLAVFFTRIQPFTPEQIEALEYYICTIPRPPNRYRPLGAPLTEAQRRGKVIFERTRTNDGRIIPKENRCITCHFPPLYTNRRKSDVGTKMWLDRDGNFDVPHLNNIYDSAPYLHNGIAPTLEEIWTRYNPYDQHGVTNDLTKDQLNDLIEYLKTL